MEKSYLELVRSIRDVVRKKAQEIPVFKESGNGAIRILAYPLCKEADDWLGGLSEFRPSHQSFDSFLAKGWDDRPDDIVDYEHTFAITSGGSRVITYNSSEDGGREVKCDCYAFSAMKIAHCSRAQDLGLYLSSGMDLDDPDCVEENGYGPYKGAMCAEVNTIIETNSADEKNPETKLLPFCGIYVCVSGADEKSDELCAFRGIEAIEEFFYHERSAFGPLSVTAPRPS